MPDNFLKTCLFAVSLALSCNAFGKPGDVIQLVDRNPINSSELGKILNGQIPVCPGTISKLGSSSVRVIALTYETTDLRGKATRASAALLIPMTGARRFSLVSYQHSTDVERQLSPSVANQMSEGWLVGGCFASQGYAVVEPDYLGLGVSQEPQAYGNAESEAIVSADAIRAAKRAALQLGFAFDGKLFLAGYSQGGQATMALHRFIQEKLNGDLTVSASAPMAGPYDAANSVRTIAKNPTLETTVELAFLLFSYNQVYSLFGSLNEAIRPQYSSQLSPLFSGSRTFRNILQALPRTPNALLQPQFMKDFLTNDNNSFYRALKQNDVYDWRPTAPVMLLQGDQDTEVPTFNATLAESTMRALGADVRLVWIPGANHDTAIGGAVSHAIVWFNSL